MNIEIRELSMEETTAVAGGDFDGPICGTPWRHFPIPPRPWTFNPIDVSPIQIVIGSHG